MEITIKEVRVSTYNPDSDIISSFLILIQLKSGKEIIINDQLPFDLRKFEGQEIDGLIYLMLSRIPIDDSTKDEPENPILQGKYLGRYEIPQKWEIPRSIKLEYEHIQEYHSIQIEGGEFIINPSVIKYYSIKEGEEFAFKSIGLELWAWQPTK